MTPAARRLVWVLSATAFIEWLGAGAVLPLLPTYLRHHGSSAAMVGLVMAAYFIAGLVLQYPAGQLSDRFGQRSVLIGGLLCYAAGSLGFLASPGDIGYVALRATQGAGAGAVEVAALSLVGVAVAPEFRGRAFARVFAGQLGGLAIGPLVGSLAGIGGMAELFAATAVTSTAAGIVVLVALPRMRAPKTGGRGRLVIGRLAAGVVITGMIGGFTTGVYESCWTLLLDHRGASDWQVGLSWTLFAAPFVAFSPIAGRMADRLDRRWLAVLALTSTGAFATSYPFLSAPALLIGLGAVEAVGVAIAYPAAQSLLAQSVPPDSLGRAQGLLAAVQTGAMAVGAGIGGVLFGVEPWVPFVAVGIITAALLGVLVPLWWSHRGPDAVAASTPVAVATGSRPCPPP
jgi:DHA1 family multidrug resistance protein-like MFS transporter